MKLNQDELEEISTEKTKWNEHCKLELQSSTWLYKNGDSDGNVKINLDTLNTNNINLKLLYNIKREFI